MHKPPQPEMGPNQSLEKICQGLAADVYRAERALGLYNFIAEHHDEIVTSTLDLPFGTIQALCLPEIFGTLGRIYDDLKYEDPICIRTALAQMSNANLTSEHSLHDFLVWQDSLAVQNTAIIRGDVKEFYLARIKKLRPTKKNNERLRRVLDIRDKEVAHRSIEPRLDRAKWDDAEWCINWARNFIITTRSAFLNGNYKIGCEMYWDIKVKEAVTSLRRLAHEAGAITDPGYLRHECAVARQSSQKNKPAA